MDQLKQLEQRAKTEQFTRKDGQLVRTLIASHCELIKLLKDPNSTIEDLYAYLPSDGNDTLSASLPGDRIDSARQAPEERRTPGEEYGQRGQADAE